MFQYKTFFIIWLSGVTSGISILLSGNSLNFWLAKEGVSTISIGLFSLVALPYAINFLWAPIIDHCKIKFLHGRFGRRLSWIILLHICAAIFILCLGSTNPEENLLYTAIFSLLLSCSTSSQDIALNALRADILKGENLGSASAAHIFGYRIGSLIGGSGAIYLSILISWQNIYYIFCGFLTFTLVMLIFCIKNSDDYSVIKAEQKTSISLRDKIIPKQYNIKFILMILLFLTLYRIADNFINVMINPFLLYLQFSEFDIATISKLFGIVTSILGSFVGGMVMSRGSLYSHLFNFGILHLIAHTLFIIQSFYPNNTILLYFVMGSESFTGGMTMTAYIALITSLCQGKYAGTQYSFFSSMMGLSRAIFPAISGYIVFHYGWTLFFTFVSFVAIPSLFIVRKLSRIDTKSSGGDG